MTTAELATLAPSGWRIELHGELTGSRCVPRDRTLYVPDVARFTGDDASLAAFIFLHEVRHAHQTDALSPREMDNLRRSYNRDPVPAEVDAWLFALETGTGLGLTWTLSGHALLASALDNYDWYTGNKRTDYVAQCVALSANFLTPALV